METVEFLKERRRMCLNYDGCKGCPCEKSDPVSCSPSTSEIEILVNIVEQWLQDHPQKTMMQDFFEKFPNAPKSEVGTPRMCPCDCGYEKVSNCPNGEMCNSLKCWSRPLED